MQQERIKKLDDWKWIAAFLVVAIHTSPLESINGIADFILTREIARIAVPLFFMITGYFSLQKETIGKTIKKLVLMYLVVTICYLPIEIYSIWPIKGDFLTIITSVVKAVFFDGTYYHLWYFPAIIEGLLIVWLLLKLGRKNAFIISLVLYIVGMLGDSYYGLVRNIPIINKIYDGIFCISDQTRNGIFFAPLFILLGYILASQQITRKRKACAYFIICMCFMIAEGLILHFANWQRHDTMYVWLPICMVFLFLYLTAKTGKTDRETIMDKWKQGPMLLYFVHPAMILVIRVLVKITGLDIFLTVSPLYYISVLGGSMVIVIGIIWIKQKIKEKKGDENVSEG